jgi:hypothetical protein
MIPIFNLAEDILGRDVSGSNILKNSGSVVGLDRPQDHQWISRQPNPHQWLLVAGPEAANPSQQNAGTALFRRVGKRVVHALRSIASTTGAHPNRDARKRRQEFRQTCLTNSVKSADVIDAGHHSRSRSIF